MIKYDFFVAVRRENIRGEKMFEITERLATVIRDLSILPPSFSQTARSLCSLERTEETEKDNVFLCKTRRSKDPSMRGNGRETRLLNLPLKINADYSKMSI